MEARFVSALQKVFSDADRFPEATDTLRLFRNERGSLQLCIRADADAEGDGLELNVRLQWSFDGN